MAANYHYFFSFDNAATAAMIDSAQAVYSSAEMQNQYPRTYVGLLLFGGKIAYRLAQYNKANDYYFRAKKLADAHLDPCERTAFHYSMAMVLYRQQNYSKSLQYFKQAYALQNNCTPQTTSIVLQQQEIQSNIGLCFLHLKQFDSALQHFDQALQIADRYSDSLGPATMNKIYGVIYGNKGAVALEQSHLEEAERLSLKSIALNDREGYEVENAMGVKLQLAEVYSRNHDFVSMLKVLTSLTHTITQANSGMQLKWRQLKAAYYEQTLQTDSALHYRGSYFQLKDSLTEERRQLTAADVTRQLRDKEQAMEITRLKKDKDLAFIYLWITVVFSGMALLILFLIYHNYRRSKKSLAISLALNSEIERQKTAREEEARQRHKLITEAVIQAQETERSLIGLELHDNINQVLTTVKLHNEMVLDGIGDPKILLTRASKYLQNCIDEIRNLSKQLSAPTLGKISLEESVQDLIDSINVASKIKITRQISGLNNSVLKQDLHLGIYRILQEQLNNVLKHSEASEVFIQLEKRKGMIRLLVTDNGKGFVVPAVKNGIGLLNMQTRAESLNGTFKLVSTPGHGCSIEIVLPCV
jgi:signal transduction histidine kinase